jgi:hypothetical protein
MQSPEAITFDDDDELPLDSPPQKAPVPAQSLPTTTAALPKPAAPAVIVQPPSSSQPISTTPTKEPTTPSKPLSNDAARSLAASPTPPISPASPTIQILKSLEATLGDDREPKVFRLYKGPDGFGFSIQVSDGILVKAIKEGGVAHKAGMQIDDQLIEANGSSLKGCSRDQVIQILQSVPKFAVSVML